MKGFLCLYGQSVMLLYVLSSGNDESSSLLVNAVELRSDKRAVRLNSLAVLSVTVPNSSN